MTINEGDAYGSPEVRRFDVGGGLELVYSPFSRKASVLSREQLGALLACSEFRTLDSHEAALVGSGAMDSVAARSTVRDLIAAGLLVPVSWLRARILAAKPNNLQAQTLLLPRQLGSVAIPTRNRVSMCLTRALRSYIAALEKTNRACALIVADDSSDPTEREATRRLLASLACDFSGKMFYSGTEERQAYLEAIKQELGETHRVLGDAILPAVDCASPGAARNTILLQTIGQVVLLADDDTVCEYSTPPSATGEIALVAGRDPTEFWFPGDAGDFRDGTAPLKGDPFSAHEAALGTSITSYLSLQGGLELEGMSASLYRGLINDEARITFTFCGLRGDCGMDYRSSYLSITGESKARLTKDEATYRRAFATRTVIRGVKRISICQEPAIMASNLGLDNGRTLPPFIPRYRNEDGVFALALRRCMPQDYSCFLPQLVNHFPPYSRRFPEIAKREEFSEGDIVAMIVSAFELPCQCTPAGSIEALGHHLIDLGKLPIQDLQEFVWHLFWQVVGIKVSILEKNMATAPGSPSYWVADIQDAIGALWAAAAQPPLSSPVDAQRFGNFLRCYGEIMVGWPTIVACAGRLGSAGIGPASTV